MKKNYLLDVTLHMYIISTTRDVARGVLATSLQQHIDFNIQILTTYSYFTD